MKGVRGRRIYDSCGIRNVAHSERRYGSDKSGDLLVHSCLLSEFAERNVRQVSTLPYTRSSKCSHANGAANVGTNEIAGPSLPFLPVRSPPGTINLGGLHIAR